MVSLVEDALPNGTMVMTKPDRQNLVHDVADSDGLANSADISMPSNGPGPEEPETVEVMRLDGGQFLNTDSMMGSVVSHSESMEKAKPSEEAKTAPIDDGGIPLTPILAKTTVSSPLCGSAAEEDAGNNVMRGVHVEANEAWHEEAQAAFSGPISYSGSIPYSGSISYSGVISYSGQIPHSGNLSVRSDSSTSTTRSFAFPILASDWNSSPVKIPPPDRRYSRQRWRWMSCFCCKKTSTLFE